MADVEELVIKVAVEVDNAKLKKLRDEMKQIKENGEKNAIKLGLSPSSTSSSSPGLANYHADSSSNYSREIVNILSISERHLDNIYEVLKLNKGRTSNGSEKPEESSEEEGVFAGLASKIGVGIAVTGVAAKLGYDLANKISSAFVAQVNENIHLRQLSQQTGLTTEAVYKLGAAATLSGTSLEAIADSNQRLADELIGGISDKKAQLLMALNINPREALLQTGGDIGKLNQLIFERTDKATRGAPGYIRSSIESLAGFNPEEQTARRYLYTNGVQNRAQKVLDKATQGGKVPFQTGSNLQDEILKTIGAKLDIAAAIRAALTASGAAASIAVETMTLKAGVVNLSADFISKMGGLINSPSNEQLKQNPQRNIQEFNKRFGEDLTNTFGPQNTTYNTFSSAVTKASGTGG